MVPRLPSGAPFVLLDDSTGARLFHDLHCARELHTAAELSAALGEGAVPDAPWRVFALTYELGYACEPGGGTPPPGASLGTVWYFRQSVLLSDSDATDFVVAQAGCEQGADAANAGEPAGISGLRPDLDATAYRRAVERIRHYIAAGDCYQVNFTFPLRFSTYGHPLALYARLRQAQPTRHGGVVRVPGQTVLSLSPELFVERAGDDLICRPMKGTAPRGATPAADAAQCAALQASEKDRAENVMIVDLLRNDLGRVAPIGGVRVETLFAVERYPTLLQMTSTVRATAPGVPPATVLGALFPCGSITGAPKVRAMQIIGELESQARGLYTGSLGYAGPGAVFRCNVAIRTLDLDAQGRGRMGVGSGIVIDSDPALEYAECLLKARFLTASDPGFRLIETLRCESGNFPRLDGHLARLVSSAQALGFACDSAHVRAALVEHAQALPAGLHRVRLTLGHAGDQEITSALFVDRAGPWRVRLASTRIDSRRGLQAFKTTARARYDRALAEVATDPDVFDVLFLNERGEVAEGARSNVFARCGERWITPPLDAGVLPGVLRAELLASGGVEEGRLTLSDLMHADELRCGNALRGWWPVALEA